MPSSITAVSGMSKSILTSGESSRHPTAELGACNRSKRKKRIARQEESSLPCVRDKQEARHDFVKNLLARQNKREFCYSTKETHGFVRFGSRRQRRGTWFLENAPKIGCGVGRRHECFDYQCGRSQPAEPRRYAACVLALRTRVVGRRRVRRWIDRGTTSPRGGFFRVVTARMMATN